MTNSKPYETCTMPVISTQHVSLDDAERMTASESLAVGDYGFGWMLYLDADTCLDDFPSLVPVRDWLVREGFSYVRLDRDADHVPTLPTYDW